MKKFTMFLLILLFLAGAAGGYYYGVVHKQPAKVVTAQPVTTIPTETETPIVEEPEAEEEVYVFPEEQYEGKYYLKINYVCNTVNVLAQDENGEYTVPAKVFLCSTGTDTPTEGVFQPGEQHKWANLFGGTYGQYSVEIDGDILFHSVPYSIWGNPATLQYWEYDKLGTRASAGCIRLQVANAKWIYDHTDRIEAIEFYSDPIPGPLGKPELEPISDNRSFRDWDPTDPNPENIWYGGSGEYQYTMEQHLEEEEKYAYVNQKGKK